jgi:radical SAM superfamily enzyme YgiQ (UPF0313 family)
MPIDKSDRLTINPDALFGLRGAKLVVWLAAQQIERLLHPALLSVLARFAGGVDVAKVLPVLEPRFRSEPPAMRERRSLDLLEQLCAAGLLTHDPGSSFVTAAPSMVADELPTSTMGIPGGAYQPRWSLLLAARPEGLVAWSPSLGCELLLKPPAIDLLCSFCGGKILQPNSGNEALVGRLLDALLLVEVDVAALGAAPAAVETAPKALSANRRYSGASGGAPVYGVYTDAEGSLNHSPLALGMLFAAAEAYKQGALLERYKFVGLFGEGEDFLKALSQHGPGVILFSDYLWSVDAHLRLSELTKQSSPHSITIHGGPSVPKYEATCREFFEANPHVDIAVHGEGEATLVELLDRLEPAAFYGDRTMLREIAGLSFRDAKDGRVVRTAERTRALDLDQLPSPYRNGIFNQLDTAGWVGAIIETNRGCPYGCTFCDWGSATQQKIRRFSLERVGAEIEWIARHGIGLIWLADANFGIFERDIEIARLIAAAKQRYGAPREVKASYAKNATDRIAEIVRIFADAGLAADGVISIQTADPATLRDIDRSNIKTVRYDEILQIFRDRQLALGTDLMFGLPGSTISSFKRDLQIYFDHDVPAKAYPTMLLPNSPMAAPEYLSRYQIETVRRDHQVYLKSTYSYTEDDWHVMNELNLIYQVFINYSVLRHLLFYLQWEWQIQSTEFLHQVQQEIRREPRRLPCTSWLLRSFRTLAVAPGAWRWLHDEIANFAGERFGVRRDKALDTVLRVQEAVLPEQGRLFPARLELPYDYCEYFRDHRSGRGRPLATYPAGQLVVTDPGDLCRQQRADINLFYFHSATLELQSELSRSAGPSHSFLSDRGDAVHQAAPPASAAAA